MTVKDYLKTRDAYWHASVFEKEEDARGFKDKVIAYNDDLVARYPFLESRNVWDDRPPEDNLHTWLDDMPDGWRIRFGNEMCEEIKQALLDGNGEEALNGYRLHQVKEKYGSLRVYSNWTTEPLEDIISHYEDLSWHTCIQCGEPSVYYTTGWIAPYCEGCARKIDKDYKTRFNKIDVDEEFLGYE